MARAKPLLCVDAPSLLYRAFYALPAAITGNDDRPVGALLGLCNIVLAVIDSYDPRAVVLCDGAEAAVYRTAAYAGYHADRPAVPEQLEWQWEQVPALAESLGWTWTHTAELEADDLLAAYARAEVAAGGSALLLSGDRDMFQAVGERVAVLFPRRSGGPELVDSAAVRRRYGIDPAQVPDLIALRGDPSDGIPGAKGIGVKTAAALLNAHGDLAGVLAAAPTMTPRRAAALLGCADELHTFLKIATLQPVAVELPADRATDRAGGAIAADRLGMKRLAARLGHR